MRRVAAFLGRGVGASAGADNRRCRGVLAAWEVSWASGGGGAPRRGSAGRARTATDYTHRCRTEAELVRQYADFPLGAVDASVIALAERMDVHQLTLDRRHFT